MNLDILVITHGHLELTIDCINAIYKNTPSPFHLIVVDDSTPDLNDGTDLTLQWLERFKPKHDNFTLFHSEKPYKNSYEVINEGLKHCKTSYLALIVNSCTVEPEWETAALQLMRTNPEIGVIGLKQLDPRTGTIQSAGMVASGGSTMLADIGQGESSHRLSKVYECDAVAWAFVLLRVEAIKGTMDECPYNGWKGWEELDTCFLIRKNGWKIFYCGLGVGYHQARSTRGFIDPTTEQARIDNRKNLENREIFAKRWGFWEDYHKYSHLIEFFPQMKANKKMLSEHRSLMLGNASYMKGK